MENLTGYFEGTIFDSESLDDLMRGLPDSDR
jgi:hypothetical protein